MIGVATLPLGVGLAWLVPELIATPDDLVWPARISTLLLVLSIAARFPLGLFNNLLVGQQRFDVLNLANFVGTVLYAAAVAVFLPHGGGLILLGALTFAVTLLRLGLPLAWLRRELPDLRLSRALVTRARLRELTAFSWSNFLVHLASKVVFATDVVVVGIVLGAQAATLYAIPAKLFALAFGLGNVGSGLLYPAFAEQEGAGESARQRRLLLAGLRGGTAAAVLLAFPLLLIPDQLIEGWVGDGYGDSSPVHGTARARPARAPADLPRHAVPDRPGATARDRAGAGRRRRREHRSFGRARLDGRDLGRGAEHAPDRRRSAPVRRARAGCAGGVGSASQHSRGRRSSRCSRA